MNVRLAEERDFPGMVSMALGMKEFEEASVEKLHDKLSKD
jgi:hypothetical protein